MNKVMLGLLLSAFTFSVANATVIINSDGTSSNIRHWSVKFLNKTLVVTV